MYFGHGEVRVYKGTGASRGVRRTTWERSLKKWELQIHSFKEFFWGGNTLGLVPSSHPRSPGYACTLSGHTSPLPSTTPVLSLYTNNSETILLCNRCACVVGEFILRQPMCVIGECTESTLWRRPSYTKTILPESPVQQMSCAIGK